MKEYAIIHKDVNVGYIIEYLCIYSILMVSLLSSATGIFYVYAWHNPTNKYIFIGAIWVLSIIFLSIWMGILFDWVEKHKYKLRKIDIIDDGAK